MLGSVTKDINLPLAFNLLVNRNSSIYCLLLVLSSRPHKLLLICTLQVYLFAKKIRHKLKKQAFISKFIAKGSHSQNIYTFWWIN